ncbi:MAG: site-specific integrase [Maritimibacter sp.]|uniref:tyrosine-type recombinase/integrase n=1 Tax=Maritimibacter sp. TaxID=2003363 RepID=UPI001E0CB7D1|nr:site-specific integrase [Maritimibacter sp.]MBL6426559.1 site-specific integrase [Maritimibacter sp.]
MTAPSKTVYVACEAWLKSCERNQLERSTMKAYRSHARVHIEPKIGHLLLTELKRSDVRDFKDSLIDRGVSQAQVKKIMVSDNKRVEVPTKDEIRTIIEKAPDSHRAMFVTAIFTGMRISELRGLSWAGVDFDRGTIKVFQRADEYCVIGDPKSRAGVREIPMSPTVLKTLREWQLSSKPNELNLVFPNGVGKVQNYSNIYNRVFKPMLVSNGIVNEAGEAKFGIHALRHAAASLFIEQGWNPKKIQTLLGHASITMTMDTYGHLFENAEEDVAMFEKLERDLLAA